MNVSATIPRKVYNHIIWGMAYPIYALEERVALQIENDTYALSRDLFESLLQNECYTELTPSYAYIEYNCPTCYEKVDEWELKKIELEIAIEEEDYEKAAKLRDELNGTT